jgi:hypothetical protein
MVKKSMNLTGEHQQTLLARRGKAQGHGFEV